MKTIIQKLIIYIVFSVLLAFNSISQPDPGYNGDGSGVGGDPIGGGASIGGGIGVLMALALGYGFKKLYDSRKRPLNE